MLSLLKNRAARKLVSDTKISHITHRILRSIKKFHLFFKGRCVIVGEGNGFLDFGLQINNYSSRKFLNEGMYFG
jgi:hypothetical protein